MVHRYAASWRLTFQSLRLLLHHPLLIVFPLMGALLLLAVISGFVTAVWAVIPVTSAKATASNTVQAALLKACFLLSLPAVMAAVYAAVALGNGALTCALTARMAGEPDAVGRGFAALRRWRSILGWSAAYACLLYGPAPLRAKFSALNHVRAGASGLQSSAAPMLVVPVLVTQKTCLTAAVIRAGHLASARWGEPVWPNAGVGVPTACVALSLFAVGLTGGGLLAIDDRNSYVGIALMAAGALAASAAVFGGLAARAVLTAAAYRFALTGEAPRGYSKCDLQALFVTAPRDA